MNGARIQLIFLYYTFSFCAVFQVTGVLSDSNGGDEPALDIQPTVFLHTNNSDSAEPETNLNPSEDNLVPDTPPHSDVMHVEYTDVLEQVPEAVFSQVGSDDANVNELINNDTPIVISRIDSATEELQKRANILSPLSTDEAVNDTNTALDDIEEDRSETNKTFETEQEIIPKNVTDKTAEDIPSFSEWAQKHLEEVEKKEQVNFSAPAAASNTTKQGVGGKLHWKNYAAVECGAKVIQANPEAEHTWAILVGSRDEYILNPCNSRIWFIVELCEAIQLKKIDLANYELFSSSPKDFTVSVSDRFPTRDWFVVGQFTANDERGVQNFEVNTETFGKYVKVEVKTHYGSEHYCPLSLFRAYGMSVFEVLQKDDPAHEQPIEDDDDDDPLDDCLKEPSGNLLSSATDAVLSMVKKAAQVLGNKVNKTNETSQSSNESKSQSPLMKSCSSPSHYVVCNNCSDVLFGRVFELLSCRREHMRNLVSIPYIRRALEASMVCHSFGFDFTDKAASVTANSASLCLESFFPPSFLGAMCNILAIAHDKISYNVSHQFTNASENVTGDGAVRESDEAKIEPAINETSSEVDDFPSSEALNLEGATINSKAGCSTDITYTSQIRPSKSSVTQLPDHSEMNTATVNANQLNQSAESLEQPKVQDVPKADQTVIDISAEVPEPELPADQVESVEKLMTELNTEASTPSVTSIPTSAGNLQGQKESVFLRLSNRIKALERNMSLSSQYLEELSKRYKKQIEEMQRLLDKTERALNEATTTERERYKRLEDKFEELTKTLETLKTEENNWKSTSFCLFFLISCTFLAYFFNRLTTSKSGKGSPGKPAEVQRRNSVDVVTRVAKKKKRRPSDQALKIVASAASGDQEKLVKKRKKKMSNPDSCKVDNSESTFAPLCASSKIWTKPTPDWVETRGQIIEDIPFPLEEPDSCTVKVSPLLLEPRTVTEGPAFLRTAANFRLGRLSMKNGSVKNFEVKHRQPSPVPSTNGSISSVTEQTPKKEKKGFKKLLKKVF